MNQRREEIYGGEGAVDYLMDIVVVVIIIVVIVVIIVVIVVVINTTTTPRQFVLFRM